VIYVVWYNISCSVHGRTRHPADINRYDPVCEIRCSSMDLTTRPRIAACDGSASNKPRAAKSVFSIRSLVDVKEDAGDILSSSRPVGELLLCVMVLLCQVKAGAHPRRGGGLLRCCPPNPRKLQFKKNILCIWW
jgi:hypothetical protein